jgi:hypothetical protein
MLRAVFTFKHKVTQGDLDKLFLAGDQVEISPTTIHNEGNFMYWMFSYVVMVKGILSL